MKTYNGSAGAIIVDVVIAVIVGLLVAWSSDTGSGIIAFVLTFLILFAMSVRIISEWNRMPVLRLGRYQGIVGPGFITIIPIIENTPYTLDLRVISTTFSAEQTLTKDNVPVNVDAILFWQVADAEKTVLNVQSYFDSMQLAAQTALRDIIGKSNLTDMLAGRDVIGKDIQDLIEERAESWGVKAIQVEIRDVKIPQELQDAMARVATSEREKDARVILAESESLAADKIIEATKKYHKDPYAMQLRALNMMYEISLNGKNLMVFIPTESKGFSIPTPIGIMGMQQLHDQLDKTKPKKSEKANQNPAPESDEPE